MAPPPITPTPHRFITSKPTNPTPKPSSSLRFEQQQFTQQPSSSQFAPTPRFNFSSTQKAANEHATQYSSPLQRRPHFSAEPRRKVKEDIEETSSDRVDEDEDEGEENDTSQAQFALPTQPNPKRRRPNPASAAITISSDPPSPSSPPSTPPLPTIEHDDLVPSTTSYKASAPPSFTSTFKATTPHPAPPRFVLPSPAPSTSDPSIPSRPPLILPPRSPSPPPETPAFFSPHRRGQKYVPGGLASTVRDWIVETAQVAHHNAHTHAKKGGQEVWDVKVRVAEFSKDGDVGAGMVLVREKDGGRRWLFAGKGGGEGSVRVGCMIGVREPTWEVELNGGKWRVGVEWKVLDG